MEYKWEINKLNVIPSLDGLHNIVKSVNWRFMLRDGMFYGDVYDVTELEYPKSESFINYDDLTEDTIVGWVKNNIDYNELVLKASQILEENKNPSVLEKDPPFIKEEKYTGEEEYLIVIDDDPEKHWGPMRWHSGRANNGLKHYGILDYTFPFDITMYQKELLPTSNEPFVVSDRVKIYLVEYTEKPEGYDDLMEYAGDLTWVLDTGKAVGTYFIHQRTVDEVKDLLIQKTIEKFFEQYKENSVEVTVHNAVYNMNSSLETQLFLYTAKTVMGNSSESMIVKLPNDNMYIEMTVDDIDQVLAEVRAKYLSIITEEKQIIDSIKSSNTIEELKEVEV
jgi:hypothetical protein